MDLIGTWGADDLECGKWSSLPTACVCVSTYCDNQRVGSTRFVLVCPFPANARFEKQSKDLSSINTCKVKPDRMYLCTFDHGMGFGIHHNLWHAASEFSTALGYGLHVLVANACWRLCDSDIVPCTCHTEVMSWMTVTVCDMVIIVFWGLRSCFCAYDQLHIWAHTWLTMSCRCSHCTYCTKTKMQWIEQAQHVIVPIVNKPCHTMVTVTRYTKACLCVSRSWILRLWWEFQDCRAMYRWYALLLCSASDSWGARQSDIAWTVWGYTPTSGRYSKHILDLQFLVSPDCL